MLLEPFKQPQKETGFAFAPSNIALCKYWGKRDQELNLPINSSLSISLGHLGTQTRTSQSDEDIIFLNKKRIDKDNPFAIQLVQYLDLFRPTAKFCFKIETFNNFPTAAGLASSASGFAALVKALDDFFGWACDNKTLSILARLGSGSASRSIYKGFVIWNRGEKENGLDSFAERLSVTWPELRIAVITLSSKTKPVSSREGMKKTIETSILYKSWPEKAALDINRLKKAIQNKNFSSLGQTAESNALAMHATMIDTNPPIFYWLPETISTFHTIWELRRQGFAFYFTIDAGPNVKVIFQENDQNRLLTEFPKAEIIKPFD